MSEQIPTPALDVVEQRILDGSFWTLDRRFIEPALIEARELENLLFAAVQSKTWNQCHDCPDLGSDACTSRRRVECVRRYINHGDQSALAGQPDSKNPKAEGDVPG